MAEHTPSVDVAGPSTLQLSRSLEEKEATHTEAAIIASLSSLATFDTPYNPEDADTTNARSRSTHDDVNDASIREAGDTRSSVSPSTIERRDGAWDLESTNTTIADDLDRHAANLPPPPPPPSEPPRAPEPRMPRPALIFERRVRTDLPELARSPPVPAVAPTDEVAAEPEQVEGDGPQRNQAPMALITRWLAFFGRGSHGTRSRRALVAMVATLSLGVVQLVSIITVLGFGASRKSPTIPEQNQWEACNKPLGIWDILWLLRTILVCGLSIWAWKLKSRPRRRSLSDAESASTARPNGLLSPPSRAFRLDATTNGAAENPTDPPGPRIRRSRNAIQAPPLYARLTLLSTLLSLAWFVTAHILVFTTVSTCRFSAPYLWWLTFGIICLTYCAIFEVFLLSLLIFIIGPILFVILNILLLCLGRHPLQNPQAIKPTIGKIPKTTVERIPLVFYIPSPPEEQEEVATPTPVHAYPPTRPHITKPRRRKFRFALLSRGKRSNREGDNGSTMDDDKSVEPATWEANWLPAELPFVRLAGNRATCAICLMDFEEPPRARGSRLPPSDVSPPALGQTTEREDDGEGHAETRVRVENLSVDELHLEDAGEGAQPLRLLKCGHAFHKTCLDPWLTDVSGRCPVCQRAIEVEPLPPKMRGGRWWERRPRSSTSRHPPASSA